MKERLLLVLNETLNGALLFTLVILWLLWAGVCWVTFMISEIVMFFPFCIIWVIAGKFYSGKIIAKFDVVIGMDF